MYKVITHVIQINYICAENHMYKRSPAMVAQIDHNMIIIS